MGQTLLAAFWLTCHAGAAGLSRLFPGGRLCESPGVGAARISVRWRRDSPGAQGGLGAVGGLQLVEDV